MLPKMDAMSPGPTPAPAAPPAPLRGFSLIELFITVAIIGVLAAIAGPSISAMVETRRAATEVDKVQAAIEGARDDARARLRCIRVRNPTSSTLTLEELAPVATGCGSTVSSTETRTFNARAVAMPNPIDITFTRAGSVLGTGADPTFVVQGLRSSGAARPYSFKVFRMLGLVRRL